MTAVNVNCYERCPQSYQSIESLQYNIKVFSYRPSVRASHVASVKKKRLLYNFHHPSSFCGTWRGRVPIIWWRQTKVGKLFSGFI